MPATLRTLCTCCKRQIRPGTSGDTCWECLGRPEDAQARDRRPLPGMRDPACRHAMPGEVDDILPEESTGVDYESDEPDDPEDPDEEPRPKPSKRARRSK